MMFEVAVAAVLGLILGSFLNALLYRYNTGRSALRGRSACMHCSHELGFFDLVPVLSYLWLRGRCRHCGCRISVQYPLVEATVAVLAVLIYLRESDPLQFALTFAIALVLVFVFVYDLRHQIIPWSASGALAVLGLLHVWSAGASSLDFAAGPLLAAPLFILSLVSRGTWMGWGDSALMLGLGFFLGLTAGLSALVMAFWAGALVGIGLMLARTRYTMKSEVPFAPFLIFGAACAYFLNVDLFTSLPALLF
jgi:leader peptidase (prepilin peptidase)/N-methyltransferase